MTATSPQKIYTLPLITLLTYVLVDYAKPPILLSIHPGIILQVVLLLVFLKNLTKIRSTLLEDRYFKLYLLLLLEMMIHGPIAANNFTAFTAWRMMVSHLIFTLSFCLFIDNAKKMKIFLTFFVLIHVLCAADKMLSGGRYFGGLGFIGESNDFALAMNIVIPISFFIGLSFKGIKRFGFWLATALFVIANVSTLSRGGFIGMGCVSMLCWWNTKARIRNFVLFLMLTTAFFSFIPQEYKAELLTIKEQRVASGTGRDRIEMWRVAWRIFVSHPIIGVGQANMAFILGDYQDQEQTALWQRSITMRSVHSVYLVVLAELGIVGITIFGAMIYDLFRKYRFMMKDPIDSNTYSAGNDDEIFLKNAMCGLFIGLCGFLVSGIFLSAFYYPHFWNLAALLTAVHILKTRANNMHNL